MLFGGGALIVGGWGLVERGRKSHSHFHSLCYSRKWGRGVSPRFHLVALMWIKITKRQDEFKILLCNFSGGKILHRASVSYTKLLGRVAFRILQKIHNEVPHRENSQRPQDIDCFHRKAPQQTLNWIPNGLRLDKRCKCGV